MSSTQGNETAPRSSSSKAPLESMDIVEDFEIVTGDNKHNKQFVPRSDNNKGDNGQNERKEIKRLIDKMKSETTPFKEELMDEHDELKRLRSNLVHEDEQKNSRSPQDDADLRYKISSMKYELMKKEQHIGELENKIKSFGQKMESFASDPRNENSRSQIMLLKKELELPEEQGGKLNENHLPKPEIGSISSKKFDFDYGKFTKIFLGSCFHVVNAVLVVILLSIYYSRDSYWDKRITGAVILSSYVLTTLISMFVANGNDQKFGSTVNEKRQQKALSPAAMFVICLGICVGLVCVVARRYEDAHTFVFNMICLMGFCFVTNLISAFLICMLLGKKGTIDNPSAHRRPTVTEKAIQKSD